MSIHHLLCKGSCERSRALGPTCCKIISDLILRRVTFYIDVLCFEKINVLALTFNDIISLLRFMKLVLIVTAKTKIMSKIERGTLVFNNKYE